MNRKELLIEAWKQTINVQIHFNDIEMKIRNIAISVLTATWVAAFYNYGKGPAIQVCCFHLTLSQILCFVGLVAWISFYLMDALWYHRLLLGAVLHGMDMEKKYAMKYPELMLSTRITKESMFGHVRSSGKINLFYGLLAIVQIVGIVLL